jgi:hypothetical protein
VQSALALRPADRPGCVPMLRFPVPGCVRLYEACARSISVNASAGSVGLRHADALQSVAVSASARSASPRCYTAEPTTLYSRRMSGGLRPARIGAASTMACERGASSRGVYMLSALTHWMSIQLSDSVHPSTPSSSERGPIAEALHATDRPCELNKHAVERAGCLQSRLGRNQDASEFKNSRDQSATGPGSCVPKDQA